MDTTTTETTVTGVQAETPAKAAKKRAKRKTFKEVRAAERDAVVQGQRAYYEPLMQELAEEINKLRDELEQERALLAEIRGSMLFAIKYHLRGAA